MADVVENMLIKAKALLEPMEAYSASRTDGVFTGTVDRSVIEYLQGEMIEPNEWYLYRIDELVYSEKEGLRREAMENVLATFRGMDDVNVVYMILGDVDRVNFYIGVSKNFYANTGDDRFSAKPSLGIEACGDHMLKPSLLGNLVGSSIVEIESAQEKNDIIQRMKSAKFSGFMDGVPGFMDKSAGERADFQGVERLVDTMVGTEFGLVVLATPYSGRDVVSIEQEVNEVTNAIEPFAKQSLQFSTSEQNQTSTDSTEGINRNIGTSKSIDRSSSTSESKGHSKDTRNDFSTQVSASSSDATSTQDGKTSSMNTNYSNPKTYSHQKGTETSTSISETVGVDEGTGFQISDSLSTSHSNQWTDSKNSSEAISHSKSVSHGQDTRSSYSKNTSVQKSHNVSSRVGSLSTDSTQTTCSLETEKKAVVSWLKYIDEVFLPRLDKGKSKGSFAVATYLFTPEYRGPLYRLANSVMALYGGEKGNVAPLQFTEFSHTKNKDNEEAQAARFMFENLQIPRYAKVEEHWKLLFSKPLEHEEKQEHMGSWLTVDELALLMGMPQREVLGLPSRNEVEYGINIPSKTKEEIAGSIDLGCLVQHGGLRQDNRIYIERKHLNKHTFVCGVTGSGKTTTCQSLLMNSELPFLVIEPAKTEYRVLTEEGGDDILYFTLGKQDVAPFFLNPFELFPGESITSRADMIKATMISAFDMEAAMPQIIEKSTYRSYELKGWNLKTSKWINPNTHKEEDPFKPDSYAFPTFSDFLKVVESVTKEQGFGERLEAEYLGSLRARLQSLIVGAKGTMLDTPRSIDFADLVTKKVVIELEEIKDGAEKSLIMGFIITNLLEAVKAKHREYSNQDKQFQHITLVEEAHRLLSRVDGLDSPNKKRGVEIFADMLAEVRKYGESLIIVDQIPNKMTPEVLKNTSTKIVHKIFAQDDKDAIGNTMALRPEQKEFLSYLDVGRAVVITEGWKKPLQVKVDQVASTTGRREVNERILRDRALAYYAGSNHTGVIPGLADLKEPLTQEIVEEYLGYLQTDTLVGDKLKQLLGNILADRDLARELQKGQHMMRLDAYVFVEQLELFKKHILNKSNTSHYMYFIAGQLKIPYSVAEKFVEILIDWYEKKISMSEEKYYGYINKVSEHKELKTNLQMIADYI